MAQSLGTLGRSIMTSIFGSRLGLDSAGYLAGPPDIRKAVTDLTSASTATAIPANGVTNITGTSLMTSGAGGCFLLSNPVPGVSYTVFNVNADTTAASPGSTALMLIRPSTAFVLKSTDGTTLTTINLTPGSAVTVTGISTGVAVVTGRTSLAGTPMNGTT